MAIPGSTTTVSVLTGTQAEPYEAEMWAVVSSGTRAVIGAPTGREGMATGSAEVVDAVLTADTLTLTLTHGQRVRDDSTQETWEVVWTQVRQGYALDHVKAGLRRVVR